MDEKYVTTNDLCKYFNVCRVTVDRWKKLNCPYIKKGRNVYFVMDDVIKWIGDSYKVKKYNYDDKDKETQVN